MNKKKYTIEMLAGQRLMLGFNGTTFNDDLKYIIGDIKAGGLILFQRNIESPEQLKLLCDDCQTYAKACGVLPLIISVDQEGGTVARLKKGFTRFEGNPAIHTLEDARHFASITADELRTAGINMNLAPVLDVAPKGVDSIMKDRAFNGDASMVSKLGIQIIQTLQNRGVMAVAKHFPGIGRTVLDSHCHLPTLDISFETLEQSDLIPFIDALKVDVSGMMLSHIFYPQLDQQWQASLSPVIAKDLLRRKIGYDGLVMTDDLDMKAIGHDMKTCILQILAADIDMALICHKGPNIDIAANEIRHQFKIDSDFYNMGKKTVERIINYKRKYLDCKV